MFASILSVVAGYLTWTVLFLGGGAGLRAAFASAHDADGGTESLGVLLAYLALSVVASLAAGAVTARLAPRPVARHVLILAGLLLATGIPVQISVWDTLPVWYHLAFLAALVPMTWVGGQRLGARA